MEVAAGIHRIEAPLGARFVCSYLLLGDEHALLVDTGLDATPREHLMPYLKSLGVEPAMIRFVLNTHSDFDHTGGNESVRELTPDVIFMCHELDRAMIEDLEWMIAARYGEFAALHGLDESDETKDWIRANARHVPMDIGLAGGEQLRLGTDWHVEIIHTPGHSRGHLSVHDPRSRSVIIADAALWNTVPTRDGAPSLPPTYRYVDTYLASIHRLQGMSIETLLTSHYPVCAGPAVAEFLGESRAFVDRLEAALRFALMSASNAVTMRDLISSLDRRLGAWPGGAAAQLAHPLQGHLDRLVQHKLVDVDHHDGCVAWRWKR